MVVVVDENSGESATAALEEQLQVSCLAFWFKYKGKGPEPEADTACVCDRVKFFVTQLSNAGTMSKMMSVLFGICVRIIINFCFYLGFSLWVSAGLLCAAGQRKGGTSCRKSSWFGNSFYRIRWDIYTLILHSTRLFLPFKWQRSCECTVSLVFFQIHCSEMNRSVLVETQFLNS